MYWLNVLLFKVPNGHNSVLHLRQKQGSSFPLRYWQSIKFRLLHLICTHKLHLSQYIELSLSPIVLVQILHQKVITSYYQEIPVFFLFDFYF